MKPTEEYHNMNHNRTRDEKDQQGKTRKNIPDSHNVRVRKVPGSRTMRPPRHDCCKEIIEILKCIPGINKDCFHKPKVPNDRKVKNLCNSMYFKDSVVPIFFHILKRYLEKKPPGNEFEKQVFKSFEKIKSNGLKALVSSLESYEKLPKDKRECIYKKTYLEWPIDQPIDIKRILYEWIHEGILLVTRKIAPRSKITTMSGEVGGPGEVRKWDRTFTVVGGNELTYKKLRAPWPWICAISPGLDSDKWYRNMDHEQPIGPGPSLGKLLTHELDVECASVEVQTNEMYENNTIKIIENCSKKLPTAGDIFATCDGGFQYTHPEACLKIVDLYPTQDVALKGFNFFSPDCKIKLTKRDDPSISYTLDAMILGDSVTPVENEDGKIIADCTVEDKLCFTIPTNAPDGEHTFNPGWYEIKVIVPNDKSEPILNVDSNQEETTPSKFESNAVLVNIWPNPNLKYNIWNDEGFCHKETSGGGEDEVWWTAGVASFKLSTGVGPHKHTLNVTRAPEEEWANMDSGESPDPYTWPLFNDTIPMPGSTAIALIGYEVDDEDVAKQQLKDWSDAFEYAIGQIWEALAGLGAEIIIEIVKAIVSGGIWGVVAAAIVAVVVLIIVAIWASWAPADLIAHDIMIFNALELFDRTNSSSPAAPYSSYAAMDDGEQNITVGIGPGYKEPSPAESTTYIEERLYWNYEYVLDMASLETGDYTYLKDLESTYSLKFKFSRSN